VVKPNSVTVYLYNKYLLQLSTHIHHACLSFSNSKSDICKSFADICKTISDICNYFKMSQYCMQLQISAIVLQISVIEL